MRYSPLALLLLVACDHAFPQPPECLEASYITLDRIEPWGLAPWDGLEWRVWECVTAWDEYQDRCAWDCERLDACPMVRAADGSLVEMGPRETIYSDEAVWLASEEFAAGEYAVVGLETEDMGWDEPFTVEPFGRDEAFQASAVGSRTWMLTGDSIRGGASADLIGFLVEGSIFLETGVPAEGELPFRAIWQQEEDEEACTLLQGTAELSPTGELWWSVPELVVASTPAEPAWDFSLHLGFDADGQHIAGIESAITIDTRELSSWLCEDGDPHALCDLMRGFGMPAYLPCPDDGDDTCGTLAVYAGTAERVPIVFASDLQPCEVLFAEDAFGDCTLGCASAPTRRTLVWLALAALGVVGWRRRAKTGRPPNQRT